MRAVISVLIAMSSGAVFVGLILPARSQAELPNSTNCNRPQNSEETAFCRAMLNRGRGASPLAPGSTDRLTLPPSFQPRPIAQPSVPNPPKAYKCQGPGHLDIGEYAWVKDPTPQHIANGGWEVCPGKVVMPQTFCRWAGQMLPQAQEQTCYAMRLKANPADYRPEWKRFEADNGAIYALDMKSVSHLYYCGGCADAVMCIVDNNQCYPPNMRRIRFDCHGHYIDTDGGGGMQLAPPRSVVGKMAAAACVGAKTN